MISKSKQGSRRSHRYEEYEKEGILTPSDRLFGKISQEVSLNSLREDVIVSIRKREQIIDRMREIIQAENKGNEKGSSRINIESKSNQIKKILHALHNISLCVVEAIIKVNIMSQSMDCEESINCAPISTTQPKSLLSPMKDLLTFYWMGKNYLIKMITDFQFLCNLKEMMNIMLPEKKTLYRNPFLIPLDLDEVVGYEPDLFCTSSTSKKNRMTRTPWRINLQRVKNAASRILFEEHRAVYGDSNVCHVFPKSIHKRGGDVVDVTLPPSPKIDFIVLEKKVTSKDLCFDDALVIACVYLFLGCGITEMQINKDSIPRESIFKLARQPIQVMFRELCIPENEVKVISIQRSVLFIVYSMMMRYLFQGGLSLGEKCESISSLKTWLFHVVSREWEMNGSSKDSEEVSPTLGVRDKTKNKDRYTKNTYKNNRENPPIDIGGEKNDQRTESSILKDHDCNPLQGFTEKKEDMSPIPVWKKVYVQEGSRQVKVLEEDLNNYIHVGDVIRIEHPRQSPDYSVSRVDDDCFFISEPCHQLCTDTYKAKQDDDERMSKAVSSLKRVNNVKMRCKDCLNNTLIDEEIIPEVIDQEKHQFFSETRIWKLVSSCEDKRLEWRREYDNGFVPWFTTPQNKYKDYFRIKLNRKTVEKKCYDTVCNPDNSAHQQRLHYFEKISLDDIVLETYKTVCQLWHPITPTIDNVKWAKLARTMKFLSNVNNSNHEVDMAFFRHSHQRKLDIKQFKEVLLDMALLKYSSARYDTSEALANMLWTTVVMLPQVNKMVWTKAQSMAVDVELRRMCAQIRISAQFRMRQQRREYSHMVSAATFISKNVRRMIAEKRKKTILTLAHYDRFYRLQHASATICQKVWRRYIQVCRFNEQKRLKEKRKKRVIAKLWKKLRKRGVEKRQCLIFRQVTNIQSIITIVSMSLKDKMDEGKGIELEIKVYVPQIRQTNSFFLDETEIRESLEKFILRKGPLSWNEMLKHDILVKLRMRLVAKVASSPIIVFCKRDIAEKGSLITRKIFPFKECLYLLSIYRSPFDFVVILYEPESREILRTKIDLTLLIDWLVEDEDIRRKETLGVLKFCDLARMKSREDNNTEYNVPDEEIQGRELPSLLRKEKEPDLIIWLVKRIQVGQDEGNGKKKIVLQYEAEAEHMERVARKFQSLWKAKCAKVTARKKVHLQYEKQFDWVSRTFFYVHIKTGLRQWTKPKLLCDEEDIIDPPDEWREIVHRDPETDALSLYYYNPLTGQTSWLSEYEAARIVQCKFRQRQIELLLPTSMSFANVVKAISMINDTETKYQQCPTKLSNSVNFALLCHCIHFDINKARILYKDAIGKSSQHPVIARAYGIFILATCQSPLIQTFEKACELFKEAEKIDPDQKMFESAKENFFYWAVVMNPNNPLALLNYALLHQCILGEFHRAEKIYRRALSQDPTNELVADNYMLFQDQRYPGGYYAGSGVPYTILKRSRVCEEQRDWGEWKKMIDPFSSKPNFSTFWYNAMDEVSSFEEPDWKEVWMKRMQRSRQISASSKSLWVEYYDDRLESVFIHNRSSGEFVWQQS